MSAGFEHRNGGSLVLALWAILAFSGCEPGPIGREYACFLGEACICASDRPASEGDIHSCGTSCCAIRELPPFNGEPGWFECYCLGLVTEEFNYPADICRPWPGVMRVDSCPATREVPLDPGFTCVVEQTGVNELVVDGGTPCEAGEATMGCLTYFNGGSGVANCLSASNGFCEQGVPVSGCNKDLARALTERVVEGWACDFDTLVNPDPICECFGPSAPEDAWQSLTYPCPGLTWDCCRYNEAAHVCRCAEGASCETLSGVDVSACPLSDEERAAFD